MHRATCDHLTPGVNAPAKRCGRVAVAHVWQERMIGTVRDVDEGRAFVAEIGPLSACSTHVNEANVTRTVPVG